MSKISADELKELFDIVSDIKPPRLEFCIAAAARTLRGWVTSAVYSQTSPVAQVESLKFAEAHLAIYHVLLNTGVRIRRSGLVKKEADSGGSVTNNVTNEFYSPEEIVTLRGQYWKEAENAAQPFQPAAATRRSTASPVMKGGWA